MDNAALLVIDLQRGAFDGARCPAIDRSTDLIGNARALVDAARASGTPVVFIQHCDEPDQVFGEGTPHWEIHDALAPLPAETVIRKRASSAFENTGLAAYLEGLATRELVLCGLQSEFCVYNTARSALGRGYRVLVAKDGHSTWPSEGRSASVISEEINTRLEHEGAGVESTVCLAASLRAPR